MEGNVKKKEFENDPCITQAQIMKMKRNVEIAAVPAKLAVNYLFKNGCQC